MLIRGAHLFSFHRIERIERIRVFCKAKNNPLNLLNPMINYFSERGVYFLWIRYAHPFSCHRIERIGDFIDCLSS